MTGDPQSARERIIAQAQYLIDEMDATALQIGRLPADEILSLRPFESELSIKEIYALIGLYDEHIYSPALRAVISGDQPALKEVDDRQLLKRRRWVDEPFPSVLSFVQTTRRDLVLLLHAIPEEAWKRGADVFSKGLTLVDVCYAVIHHDADLLRSAALRLYDCRTTP